ncbi:MAG TPA: hypothetical protein VN131_04250 [Mobilitalea sp.]|nr:hypothetical protein [Mobilitalea sp.]
MIYYVSLTTWNIHRGGETAYDFITYRNSNTYVVEIGKAVKMKWLV